MYFHNIGISTVNYSMIEILKQHLISRLGNDVDHLDTVLSYFKPIHLARNEYLVQQG